MNGEVTLILKTANLSYELRFERNISGGQLRDCIREQCVI